MSEMELRATALLNAIPEPILLIAGDGLIVSCNEACAELLQCPYDHVVGARLRDFVSPPHADVQLGRVVRAIHAGGRLESDITLAVAGGISECTITPLGSVGCGPEDRRCFVLRFGKAGVPEAVRKFSELNRAFREHSTRMQNLLKDREVLEDRVKERTVELEKVASELERHNKLMSGREETVLKLKETINELLKELGRSPKFKTTARTEGAVSAVAKIDESEPSTLSEPRPSADPTTGVEVDRRAAEKAGLEKTDLEIAFIPILCSAPLIYAHSRGFFARNGLDVNLKPAPGWSGVKNLMVYGKVDAAHMLAPMPLMCKLGINARKADIQLAAMQNVNGQALTLAQKHLGIKDVRDMKGFTFGVPYRFSMDYYLLCQLLAAAGVNPLTDVTIKEVAPPRMPYYLAKGWVDGVFAPEPFNQIAVYRGIGFIYVLSKEIWAGHPCCCFGASQDFIDRHPNTYRAMLTSVLQAELALHRANIEERKAIAREICGPGHLSQKDTVPVEQALSGEFPDGRGRQHVVPDRIDFNPYLWPQDGEWILSQMQRWAQLPGKVDYRKVAESVIQDDTRELAEALGFEKQCKPSPEAVHPFASMGEQSFCAFQEQSKLARDYDVSESVRKRLGEVCSHLGAIAGGETDAPLEITSGGEIGQLEQVVNDTLLNLRFSQEAVSEQLDLLELETRAEKLEKNRKVLLGLTEDAQQARKEAEKEITHRKRAEEAAMRLQDERLETLVQLGQMATAPMQEITDFALEEAVRLTKSQIGYLAFMNEEETVLTMHSWSKTAMEQCAIIDKPIVYPIESTGLWGEAVRQRNPVITNDYAAPNPLKKGHPEGHVHVKRHMNVPVFDGERIVAVAGVGNKAEEYGDSDAQQLTVLMQGMWRLVQHRRAQEALKKAHDELEIRVEERTAELRRSNAELEEFAYVASHDLQEPLRMVGSYMGLLERRYKGKLDSDADEFIEFAVDGAKRMQTLIQDLLAYSRVMTRGKEFEPLDLNGVTDEVMKNLEVTITEHDADVTRDELPMVSADRGQLARLIQNLVSNAIKFHGDQPPRVHIGAEQSETEWIFQVQDNGIGIDPKYLDRVFKIFQRLHTREEYSGTGIGLAVCKRIVDRHGGRIWFESEPGEGTTFYFTLPEKGVPG